MSIQPSKIKIARVKSGTAKSVRAVMRAKYAPHSIVVYPPEIVHEIASHHHRWIKMKQTIVQIPIEIGHRPDGTPIYRTEGILDDVPHSMPGDADTIESLRLVCYDFAAVLTLDYIEKYIETADERVHRITRRAHVEKFIKQKPYMYHLNAPETLYASFSLTCSMIDYSSLYPSAMIAYSLNTGTNEITDLTIDTIQQEVHCIRCSEKSSAATKSPAGVIGRAQMSVITLPQMRRQQRDRNAPALLARAGQRRPRGKYSKSYR
jgi:hypothetical protein